MTSFRPRGIYRERLLKSATGLTGNIEKYFSDLGPDSAWLGGAGESWERGPYYLDGLIPLAYLLENRALIAKAEVWLAAITTSATSDGFFGPSTNFDWWPRLVAAKVLMSSFTLTGNASHLEMVQKFVNHLSSTIESKPPVLWAHARILEIGASLNQRLGVALSKDAYDRIRNQSLDWDSFFRAFPFIRPTTKYLNKRLFHLVAPVVVKLASGKTSAAPDARSSRINRFTPVRAFLHTHGVNIAMAIKYPIYNRIYGSGGLSNDQLFAGFRHILGFHGNALDLFSCDEHLNGTRPDQGVELCAIVEAMFSMEEIIRLTGDGRAADYLEFYAYNALAGSCTDDMCAHQYVMQANQTKAGRKLGPFYDVGREGTVFGVAPNFGCCAANMHQGWPKLALSALSVSNDMISIFAYIPGDYEFMTANGSILISIAGAYPYGDDVLVKVQAETTMKGLTLRLRLPYKTDARLSVDNADERVITGSSFIDVPLEDNHAVVALRFDFAIQAASHGDTISVRRGPLLFALPIPSEEKFIRGVYPFHDREFVPLQKVVIPVLNLDESGKIQVLSFKQVLSQERDNDNKIDLVVKTTTGAVTLIPFGHTILRIAQFKCKKERSQNEKG